MYKENLLLLANGLKDVVPNGCFDMDQFRSRGNLLGEGLKSTYWRSPESCGTHGCVLGWAPHIKGLEFLPEELDIDVGLKFFTYGERVFGMPDYSLSWKYIFDSKWTKFDNTLDGAIQRIRDVIEGKDLVLPWRKLG